MPLILNIILEAIQKKNWRFNFVLCWHFSKFWDNHSIDHLMSLVFFNYGHSPLAVIIIHTLMFVSLIFVVVILVVLLLFRIFCYYFYYIPLVIDLIGDRHKKRNSSYHCNVNPSLSTRFLFICSKSIKKNHFNTIRWNELNWIEMNTANK